MDLPAKTTKTIVTTTSTPPREVAKRITTAIGRSNSSIVNTTTNSLLGKKKRISPLDLLTDPETCKHVRIDMSQVIPVCDDCGTVISVVLKDDNGIRGESRCFHHNSNPRDISPDLRGKGISEAIQQIASYYYLQVINYDDDTGEGDTRRKERRTAIIAACVMQSYKDMGDPKTQEHMAEMFDISVTVLNKKGIKALSHIITNPMGRKGISPMDFVPDMLKNLTYLKLGDKAQNHIEKLWKHVQSLASQTEHKLDSRRPKSLAAAMIYLLVKMKSHRENKGNEKFDLTRFGQAVNVSTNTFQSISQEIAPTISGAENLNL